MSEARQGLQDGGPGTEEDRVAVLPRCILRTRVRRRAARNTIEEQLRSRLRAVDRTDSWAYLEGGIFQLQSLRRLNQRRTQADRRRGGAGRGVD